MLPGIYVCALAQTEAALLTIEVQQMFSSISNLIIENKILWIEFF